MTSKQQIWQVLSLRKHQRCISGLQVNGNFLKILFYNAFLRQPVQPDTGMTRQMPGGVFSDYLNACSLNLLIKEMFPFLVIIYNIN